MNAISLAELTEPVPAPVADPYVMPATLSPERRALWLETEAKNARNAANFAVYLEQWHAERDARLMALQPAGAEPLFSGSKFVALDTIEHSIHQAQGSLQEAGDADIQDCCDRLNARMSDSPREALRYFTERAEARKNEDWREMLLILKIKQRIATTGEKHVA